MMTDRVRLTLDLSTRLNSSLEGLAARKSLGKADTLRFAIEFLSAAIAAKDSGMSVGAWGERDGVKIEREFIGL